MTSSLLTQPSVNHRGAQSYCGSLGKGSTDDVIRGVGQDGGSQALASHRGQMSKEDRERLEQQAMWAREPDVFAELGMAPSVQPTPPTSLSIQNSRITTASLTYQAPTSEIVSVRVSSNWSASFLMQHISYR